MLVSIIAVISVIAVLFSILYIVILSSYRSSAAYDYMNDTARLIDENFEKAVNQKEQLDELFMTAEYLGEFSNNIMLQDEKKLKAMTDTVYADLSGLVSALKLIDGVYVIGRDANQMSYAYYSGAFGLDTSLNGLEAGELLDSGVIGEIFKPHNAVSYISAERLKAGTEEYLNKISAAAPIKKLVAELSDKLLSCSYVGQQLVIAVYDKESFFSANSLDYITVSDIYGNTVASSGEKAKYSLEKQYKLTVGDFELSYGKEIFSLGEFYITFLIPTVLLFLFSPFLASKVSKWGIKPIVAVRNELFKNNGERITGKFGEIPVKKRIFIALTSVFLAFYLLLSSLAFFEIKVIDKHIKRQLASVNECLIVQNSYECFYEPMQAVPIPFSEIAKMSVNKSYNDMPDEYAVLKTGVKNASMLELFLVTDIHGKTIYASKDFGYDIAERLSVFAERTTEFNKNELMFFSCAKSGENGRVLVFRKIYEDAVPVGYLVGVTAESSYEMLLSGIPYSEITVSSSAAEKIYSNINDIDDVRAQLNAGVGLSLRAEKNNTHTVKLSEPNINVTYYCLKSVENSTLYLYINLFILIFLFGLLTEIILSLIFSRYISKNIYALIESIGKGESCLKKSENSENEVHYLVDTYNELLERIKQLTQENILSEKHKNSLLYLKTKAELNALRNQVNAHFIFNVLSIIQEEAVRNKNTVIIGVVRALSAMIRYSMDSNVYATLSKEIEIAEQYVYIQTIRYGTSFVYHVETEEELKDEKILRLIIQPLIENAVEHGIFNTNGGNVYLNAFLSCGFLNVTVTDDGVGMHEKELNELWSFIKASEEIANEMSKKKRYGIALRNIYQRIKSYYGEAADMIIKTAFMEGMTVKIIIPLNGAVQNFEEDNID